MKKVIIAVSLVLSATASFASPDGGGQVGSDKDARFFECGNIANIEEYRVGINLENGKAAFFDNDTTSYMQQTEVRVLESMPTQTQRTYEGQDELGQGTRLKLMFNQDRKYITLYSVDADGNLSPIGSAQCLQAATWPVLK